MVTPPSAFNPTIEIANPKDYRESEALKPGRPIAVEGQATNQLTPTGVRNVDQSQALAYSGAAQLIGSAGNLAGLVATESDTIAKNYIEGQVYNTIDKEKDAYTRALQATNKAGKGGNVGGLVSDNGVGEVPADVSALEGKLEGLSGAKAGGKISQTEYYGRLASIAKDFRNNYSGWRDFIDAKVSHEVGGDPANMYIRSMVADINRANAAAGAAQKKDESFAQHNVQVGNIDDKLRARVFAGDEEAKKAMYKQVAEIEGRQRLNRDIREGWATYNVAQEGQDKINLRAAGTDVATEVLKTVYTKSPAYGDDSKTPSQRF
jgi:hypothetical protein